jgi:outer membrane lipoprotein SlyB
MKALLTIASAAALLAMTGCATAPSSGPMFRSVSNNSESSTRLATLDSVRFGTMPADTSNSWQAYAGQVAGALIGGLAANTVKNERFRPVATAGGAVAGAYAGSKIQATAGEVAAVELTYTFDGCKGADCTKTVVQRIEDGTAPAWKPGSRVRVTYGNGARVIPL